MSAALADARIWQAVIAGLFIGIGWFVNGWLTRRDAARLRAEKMRDMHRAIYAEIGVYLSNLASEVETGTYAAAMLERMEHDPDFVPFIPHEHNDTVFRTLLPDISVLPRQTIDPIVAYYSQLRAIAALIDDMRGETFRTMAQSRRIAIYSDYIDMKAQALAFGRFANTIITEFGTGGPQAADRMAKRLSNPASDPSDRSQG